jgi:aspartate dehydrogenase
LAYSPQYTLPAFSQAGPADCQADYSFTGLMNQGTTIVDKPPLRVGIGGLGAIGRQVALSLDAGMPGLQLCAVSARDVAKASAFVAQLRANPSIVPLRKLASHADVIVECARAAVYDEISVPAIEAGRIMITLSSGALLFRKDLIDRASETGARIIVPSGGILGIDAIRAAAESEIRSLVLVTRKSARSFADNPNLNEGRIDNLTVPEMIFAGNALDAAKIFPENMNVAATLCLAGFDPGRMRVEVWADPAIEHNLQELRVEADTASFRVELRSVPLSANPRTGSLTPLSAVAALRSLTSPLLIGTS